MSPMDCNAYIPHVGWLRHECGEEVIALLRQGYFEASEQAFFWLHGRPGDVFIDGGAHIGLYSIVAQRAAGGDARIFAVEPSGATAGYLAANLEANGAAAATIVRAALWKEPGEVRFAAETEGKAAYAHIAFDAEDAPAVPATTLDQIVQDAGVAQVTLAKIDVEGAEPEALQGAARSIARGALPLLMVEFTEQNLQRRGASTQELRERIERAGYTLGELDAQTLQLVPFDASGPIWYRNLFACADIAAVNARLAAAGPRERAIARDILDRAAACSRFKELEELERLKAVEAESDRVRQWAEDADARAAAAAQLAEERTAWAERSDAMVKQLNEQLEPQREQLAAQAAQAAALREELEAHRRAALALQNEHANTRAALAALEEQTAPLRVFARRHPHLARLLLRWFR